MTVLIRSIRNWSVLAIAFVVLGNVASGAVFTAVASGNWSAAATWGGVAPGFINTIDQITVPVGVTVTMDQNVTIDGPLASVTVLGTLTSNANTTLTHTQGTLAGTGTINVGTLAFAPQSMLAFTGNITAEFVTNASTGIQSAADITVSKGLTLAGGLFTTVGGGTLELMNDATITISGGMLGVNGGLLALANAYSVRYNTASATTGLELSGSGLRTVTVDVGAGNSVTLGSNLTIGNTGGLSLMSGTLVLNGRDLTVNGSLSSATNASISSSSASSVVINSNAGVVGALNFTGTTNAIKNLTLNVGTTNTAQITGTLEVTNSLNLMAGTLRFAGSNLTISGGVTGSGTLSGDASSNLTVNTTGGISNVIRFAAGGQTLNNLTLNVGGGNSIRIGSDLTVNGTTSLASGNLNISDVTLTVHGDITGAGQIVVNNGSGLAIETNNGLTTALNLSGSTIGALTINTDASKTVSLGSDLTIAEVLSLQGGTLVLNGNDITIAGDVLASAGGSIRSTATSDINLTSTTGTTGILNFSGTGNAVRNLTVNVGSGNSATIQGALDVTSTLNLQSGTLNFGGTTLTLSGAVTGTGSLAGNTSSNLIINTAGGIASGLRFAAGSSTVNNLTVNVGSNNAVKLASNLAVNGTTTLTSGNLDISDYDLTIGGALNGSGSIVSNANSGITINTPGGLTLPISFTGGVLGSLGINVGTGKTVTLGSDLDITESLSITGGTLVLNGNDLSINGNVTGGVNGFVRSTAASDIELVSTNGITGVLNFEQNSAVRNLTVNVGSTGSARIAGDLDVMNALNLTSGTLNFSGADLTLNGTLSGSGNLSADNLANLTINTNGGITSALTFATGGQTVNNLLINVGSSNAIDLGSDLVVHGTTTLTGNLDISDVDLTLEGALNGTGSIVTNANSSVTVTNEAGLTAPLNISGPALGTLTVDVGDNASVMIGSDLNIAQSLELEGGVLDLNDNDLNVTGVVSATGSGRIASSNTSNISITSVGTSLGRLMFDATSNSVNNLTIDVADGQSITLGTDATVDGVLKLTSGRLNIADNVLVIGTNGSIEGASTTSFIETAVNGALALNVDAGVSTPTVFPVGTTTGFFPAAITLAEGSASGVVRVGVREGVYSQGISGTLITATEPAVNATWDITSDIASNLKMNMDLAWQTSAEVNGFNRAQAYISHYINAAWDANAVAQAQVRAEGMYSISRENVTSLSPFAVFDGATTDIAADVIAASYNVYPSPTTDVVVIEHLAEAGSPMTVEVLDAQGRLVASSTMSSQQHTISVSSLASGVYYIKLTGEHASTTKSFIKL